MRRLHAVKEEDKGVVIPASRKEWRLWYVYEGAVAAWSFGTSDFISVYIVDQARIVAQENWCASEYGIFRGDAKFEDCMETYWAVDYETKGECSNRELVTNSSCVEDGSSWSAEWKDGAGEVSMWGIDGLFYASTYTTATTVSVVIQLVVILFLGSIADYGYIRKPAFNVFNILVGLALFLIFFGKNPDQFAYNAAMVVIVTSCITFSSTLYNSWLAVLTENHPHLLERDQDASATDVFILRNKISASLSRGSNIVGFVCGVFSLLLSAVLFMFASEHIGGDEFTVRLVCVICAVWYLVCSFITSCGVKNRPGMSVEKCSELWCVSLKSFYGTFKECKSLSELMVFLLAYFVYSDGLSTIPGAAAVFASVELGMSFSELIIAYLIVAFVSALSAWFFVWLNKRFKAFTAKRILMFNLVVLGCIPLWGIWGIYSASEYYIAVTIYAMMNGSVLTLGRSIYSSIIPLGHEAHFFSLYALTDKGTAWLGPLVLTIVSTNTGSFRQAFSTLVSFFFVGVFILFFFNHERADEQRRSFEEKEGLDADLIKKAEEEEDERSGLPLQAESFQAESAPKNQTSMVMA